MSADAARTSVYATFGGNDLRINSRGFELASRTIDSSRCCPQALEYRCLSSPRSLSLIGYHVEDFQVSSKLPLDRDEFDFEVRLPENAKEELSREFPAFAKPGAEGATGTTPDADFPQLTPGKPGLIASNRDSRGCMVTRIRAQQQTLSRLAEILRMAEPRPVVDKTGLMLLWLSRSIGQKPRNRERWG